MARYSAVFDVGKTNKKVLILNEQLETVASAYQQFPADESKDIHIEQFTAAKTWLFEQLKKFAADYDIAAISVTTHGATIVCVDEAGELTLPAIAYTSNVEQHYYDSFFEKFGDKTELHKRLATPFLGGLLNFGMCAYYISEAYPQELAETKYILNLPNYFVYALTGIAGAEPTSTGCHSYFWDFEKNTWSFIAEELGLMDKLPDSIHQSHEVIGCVSAEVSAALGLAADCKVTYGIHDSNSSLVPYLVHSKGDFVLNSTGTWCVSMCPSKEVSFTDEEIEAGAFYNVSALGEPVKTAIFMGGNEHDVWASCLQEHAQMEGFPAFDHEVYQRVISEKKCFVLPGVMPNGPFPNSVSRIHEQGQDFLLKNIQDKEYPNCFEDSAYVYAALNISLALQSVANFDNVDIADGMTIYIEGGFRKNTAYHALLAALYPNNDIVLSSLEEATAFGAALMNTAALTGRELTEIGDCFNIETEAVPQHAFKDLEAYKEAFFSLART